MRTRFIFRAADQEGANASADFIGKREVWKKTRTTRFLKPVTISRRQEQEHLVKAGKLTRLPDHTPLIVHPSKKFLTKRIPPRDGRGKIYPWFR
jgi:type IV secretory pathway TraG/TraD family ATPase VirD4